MGLSAYINFDGQTREAVEYYSKIFGVEPTQISTFSEMPSDPAYPMPEETKNRIAYAALNIAGGLLNFSDIWPGMPFTVGNNITVMISSDDMDLLRSAYEQLKEGGSVGMELQETFWSKLYGSVTDKYGIGWQFNHGAA